MVDLTGLTIYGFALIACRHLLLNSSEVIPILIRQDIAHPGAG